jgi:hypothetical protein
MGTDLSEDNAFAGLADDLGEELAFYDEDEAEETGRDKPELTDSLESKGNQAGGLESKETPSPEERVESKRKQDSSSREPSTESSSELESKRKQGETRESLSGSTDAQRPNATSANPRRTLTEARKGSSQQSPSKELPPSHQIKPLSYRVGEPPRSMWQNIAGSIKTDAAHLFGATPSKARIMEAIFELVHDDYKQNGQDSVLFEYIQKRMIAVGDIDEG